MSATVSYLSSSRDAANALPSVTVPVAGTSPEPRPRTRLRLTMRGRVVLSSLFAVLVGGALLLTALFGGAQAVASNETSGAEFGYLVVQPGATLWQIAEQVDPSVDPRDLVAEIVRLNKLSDSGVQAGQAIALPLRYAEAAGVASADALGL